MKKFILNADNFGKSKDHNRAVLNGYNNGFIKSASLIANGEAYDIALNEILPECQMLSVGVHLNLTEGKSLLKHVLITDDNANFNKTFKQFVKLAKKRDYQKEIENEFRAQIEKIQRSVKVDHIDSSNHIHAIPEIFNIVCKLATEYNIPYIRSHYEEIYIVPKPAYILNYNYIKNINNIILLNHFTNQNRKTLKMYNLKTNTYLVGVGYSGVMDKNTLYYGLKTVSDEDNIIVEASINPCSYLRNINDSHSREFKLTQDKILEDKIKRMGYDITNHKI